MTPDTALTLAIIQARMGSSRLPGKVLLDIAGQPMLERVVERTRLAETIDKVVVATTRETSDDPVAEFCQSQGYNCYRGDLHDVLDRYYQASRAHQAGHIVRITADCPLIDPAVIDRTVHAYAGRETATLRWLSPDVEQSAAGGYCDFAANRLPPPWGRSYPIGLDTEVCSFGALEIAWHEANQPHQREHVMPYFYDHHKRFRVLLVDHFEDYGTYRWTVDTPQDLALVRQIFAHFPGRCDFSWLEVLELFQLHPELVAVNAQVHHKIYTDVDKRQ